MSYNKIDNIFDFVAEFNSKEQSDEWINFLNNFNDFLEQIKPYIFPNKNGKYKSINLKNQKKLKTLFENTTGLANKFLNKEPEDEIDEIRHQIVQNLTDNFLSKLSVKFDNLNGQKSQTLKFSENNKEKVDGNNNIFLRKSVAKIFGIDDLFYESVKSENLNYEIVNDTQQKNQITVDETNEEVLNQGLENSTQNQKAIIQLTNKRVMDYICGYLDENKYNNKKSKKKLNNILKISKFQGEKKDIDIEKLEDSNEEINRQTLIILGMGIIASEMAKKVITIDDVLFFAILAGMGVSLNLIDIAIDGLISLKTRIKDVVYSGGKNINHFKQSLEERDEILGNDKITVDLNLEENDVVTKMLKVDNESQKGSILQQENKLKELKIKEKTIKID